MDTSEAWQLLGTVREAFTMNSLGINAGSQLQPVKCYPCRHKKLLDVLLAYRNNKKKVFQNLCLSCFVFFLIGEKNSYLNTLRDAQISSKMGECQYTNAQSHYTTSRQWNLFYERTTRFIVFKREIL